MRIGRVNENFPDILPEIIPHGPEDDVVLLVDKRRCGIFLYRSPDGFPDLGQVVEVPLELFAASSHPGRAYDHAHAIFDG